MNLSNISNESTFGRVLRLPLKLIPHGTRVTVRKGGLKGKKWIVGSHIHGCWLGNYEQEKQQRFSGKVTEGAVVFDIGANVGFYTLLASTLVGRSGYVYAFEPLPRNIAYLKEHLQLNHVDNVTVIEAAVSEGAGVATFDDVTGSAMGHLSPAGKLQVETVGVDDLMSRGVVRPPSLLKLDVEGNEMLVLSGARSTLERFRPDIFLATHGPQVHREACDFLRALGYQLEAIDRKPVDETDELIAYCQ